MEVPKYHPHDSGRVCALGLGGVEAKFKRVGTNECQENCVLIEIGKSGIVLMSGTA